MSTTALKLGSLAIRTLAKPIAYRIKVQAHDHPRFRKICINLAQKLHVIDMRLRLGILRDTNAIAKAEAAEREHARKESSIRAAMKLKEKQAGSSDSATTAFSKTRKSPVDFASFSPASASDKGVVKIHTPRIRPLTENKAIEKGADFISEFFLFSIAGGLIVFESFRSRRREANRRDEVSERLEMLEERNRQNAERLAALEDKERIDAENILMLEEVNWRLRGRKGVFPGREQAQGGRKKGRKGGSVDPTPLWEQVDQKKGLWERIWVPKVTRGESFASDRPKDEAENVGSRKDTGSQPGKKLIVPDETTTKPNC